MPPTTDTLSVELILNDQQATVVLDGFKAKMNSFGNQIDAVSKKKIIDDRNAVQLDTLEIKANKLRLTLENISKVETKKGFDTMAFYADKASSRVVVIKNELSDLYRKIQEGASKPILAQYIKESKSLEDELDNLITKSERFKQVQNGTNAPTGNSGNSGGGNSGDDGNGKIGRLRGFGAVFRAIGSPINESEINIAITGYNLLNEHLAKTATLAKTTTAATAGLAAAQGAAATATAAAAAATTAEGAAATATTVAIEAETAALAGLSLAGSVIGGIVLAGAVLVKGLLSYREEREKHLKLEKEITVEYGKQAKAIFDAPKKTQLERDTASTNDYLGGASLDELKRQKKQLEQFQEIETRLGGPTDELRSAILQNDAQIRAKQQQETAKQDAAFQQHWDDYVKSQDDAKKARQEKVQKSFQLDLGQPDQTLDKLKNLLEQVKNSKDLLPDAASGLTNSINSKIKEISRQLLALKDQFRDGLISSAARDNPLVKLMSDFEFATDNAQKKFGVFGADVVKKIADIERADLAKAINLKVFDNNLQALRLDQQGQQLAALPDRKFASFERALDQFSNTVEFAVKDNSLTRKINEANYYADTYNPNAPKSFAQANKDYFHGDISPVGQQIRNAIEDIGSIKSISNNSGIYGQGVAADKILSLIPDIQELVKRLKANGQGDDARILLNEYREALVVSREAQRQKFQDSIEDQKAKDFGRQFAYQQIGLVNNSNLTDAEKAQQRLAITGALGNDLDPRLKSQQLRDFVAAAADKRGQEAAATKRIENIEIYTKTISEALTKKGVTPDQEPQQVTVVLKDETGGKAVLPQTPTKKDTQNMMNDKPITSTWLDQFQN